MTQVNADTRNVLHGMPIHVIELHYLTGGIVYSQVVVYAALGTLIVAVVRR